MRRSPGGGHRDKLTPWPIHARQIRPLGGNRLHAGGGRAFAPALAALKPEPSQLGVELGAGPDAIACLDRRYPTTPRLPGSCKGQGGWYRRVVVQR